MPDNYEENLDFLDIDPGAFFINGNPNPIPPQPDPIPALTDVDRNLFETYINTANVFGTNTEWRLVGPGSECSYETIKKLPDVNCCICHTLTDTGILVSKNIPQLVEYSDLYRCYNCNFNNYVSKDILRKLLEQYEYNWAWLLESYGHLLVFRHIENKEIKTVSLNEAIKYSLYREKELIPE